MERGGTIVVGGGSDGRPARPPVRNSPSDATDQPMNDHDEDRKLREWIDRVAIWDPVDYYGPTPPSVYADELPPGEDRDAALQRLAELRERRRRETTDS